MIDRIDFEVYRMPHGIRPKESIDGDALDWFDDARAYGARIDAPEFVPAGSTLAGSKACPARGYRVARCIV